MADANLSSFLPVQAADVNGAAIQTVNARDLHGFLEIGRDFSNWIRNRIEQYGFQENQDFIVFANSGEKLVTFSDSPEKGRPRIEYHLSLDMAKELAMVERNEKGRQARRYFIQCERIAKGDAPGRVRRAPADPVIQQTNREKARLSHADAMTGFWLKQAKRMGTDTAMARAIAAEKVMEQTGIDLQPLLVGNVVEDRPLPPRDIGKLLGISAQKANLRLAEAELQARDENDCWMPTERGRPYCTVNPYKSRNSDHTGYQILWYPTVLALLDTDETAG